MPSGAVTRIGRVKPWQRCVHAGLGEGDRGVDAAWHLQRTAGPVGGDFIASHCHLHLEDDRFGVRPQPVDVVGEFVHAIWYLENFRARQALGIVVQLGDVERERLAPVTLVEFDHSSHPGEARGHLRLQVANHLVGHAHVERNDV